MADNVLNKRFFTNTYITGSGRHNYLRIDHLEDPLFTSFTFDIDYVTSPLFYTIGYSEYGYPNIEGLADNIEEALSGMYAEYMSNDQGYDILPVFSASILDGNKLGFGLQQNVYMDMPLYGATEYIYMVDKRNGGANQNDAGYDSNQFLESGSNPNTLNSFKLGASLNSIVNDSDKEWAKRKKQQNEDQKDACEKIMNDPDVQKAHTENGLELKAAEDAINLENSYKVDDDYYTEAQLMDKVKDFKQLKDDFEYFQREIVEWANDILSGYKQRGAAIYNKNKCAQKVIAYENISENWSKCEKEMEKEFGSDFKNVFLYKSEDSYVQQFYKLYCELETYAAGVDKPADAHNSHVGEYLPFKGDDGKSFLLDKNGAAKDGTTIRQSKIIEKFRSKLEYFDMLKKDGEKEYLDFNVSVYTMEAPYDWAYKSYQSHLSWIDPSNSNNNIDCFITWTMSFKCDINSAFDEKFTSKKVEENEEFSAIHEINIRIKEEGPIYMGEIYHLDLEIIPSNYIDKYSILKSDEYRGKAEAQQLSDTLITADRGVIYDASMNVLAESAAAWLVYINPSKIKDDKILYYKKNYNVCESLWQESFYDTVITSQQQYENICNYIQLNPTNWILKKEADDF